VISRNNDDSTAITIKKSPGQPIKEISCDFVLTIQFISRTSGVQRHTLDEIATHNDCVRS
jgi:hypothetical protein